MDRLKAAEAFLQAAREDIDIANIVYGEHFIRSSVYHIGQGIEKTTKAYLLGLSDVPTDCLKTHDGVLLQTTLLKWAIGTYRQPMEGFLQIAKSSHSYSERELSLLDISQAEKKIKALRNYAKARKEDKEKLFPTYLEDAHRPILEGQLTMCENLVGDRLFRQIEGLETGLGMLLEPMPGFRPDLLRDVESQIGGALGATVLLPLSAVFIFHDQDPRYPPLASPPDTGWDSYKQGAPIVDAIPRLLHLADKVHNLAAGMIDSASRRNSHEGAENA